MAILITANCSIVYLAMQVQLQGSFSKRIWHFVYVILFIPTLYLIGYLLFLLCARSRSRFIQRCCVSKVRLFKNRAITYFANTEPRCDRLLSSSNSEYDRSSLDNFSNTPTHSSLDNFSNTPDRVDNPQRYCNLEWSNQFGGITSSVVTVDREKDKEELRSKMASLQ